MRPALLFKIVFVMVAGSAAARLIFARETLKLGDDLPKGPLMKAFGFFVGLLSTLMEIGGGLFANLLMTFYARPIHQAVATSAARAVLISIPGALSDQPAYRVSACGLRTRCRSARSNLRSVAIC